MSLDRSLCPVSSISPRTRRSPLLGAIAWAALTVLLPACKQGEGERCETNSDCETGLECDRPMGIEGVCKAEATTTVAPVADAASLSLVDAAPDAVSSDAPAADTAATDGPATDATAADGPASDTASSD